MDSQFLHSDVDYLGFAGIVLSDQQKATLQTSLIILQEQMRFAKVYFWGMIRTTVNEYFIAEGVETDTMNRRTLFSTDCSHWKLLIPSKKDDRKKAEIFTSHFTGDLWTEAQQVVLTTELIEDEAEEEEEEEGDEEEGGEDGVSGVESKESAQVPGSQAGDEADKSDNASSKASEPEEKPSVMRTFLEEEIDQEEEEGEEEEEEESDDSEESERPPEDRVVRTILVLKEETRLASVVALINKDTRIVPRGAYLLTPTGQVIENQMFSGLSQSEAIKMENYMHLRPSERLAQKTLLVRADLDPSYEFLDVIAEDLPKGCWSAQYERGGAIVIIKSLWWDGYVFFHVPRSRLFGSLYVGNGIKNWDLPFML